MNRFQKYYKEIICYDLLLKENYNNILELPKFNKITINTTSKQYLQDKKSIIAILLAIELITGQKAKLTYAKKSIAGFKLRQGQTLGCKNTLRNIKMYEFLELFVTIILPKLRDFSGISKKQMEKFGNFSIGLNNLMFFPVLENNFEIFQIIKGINFNFVLNTKSKQQALLLYTSFQLPNKN